MTEATKHTPGPWSVIRAGGLPDSIMAPHEDLGRIGICKIAITNDHEANAALIAAAPDLLAALKALRNECSGTPRPSQLVQLLAAADTAIAKAEAA